MTKPPLDQLQHLMSELLLPFYQIQRDAVPPFLPRRFENDAEHSWSTAVLACSLAPLVDKRLDIGSVAQFALVHDLVELYANDTSPWQHAAARADKESREHESLELIRERFAHFPWIVTTIEQYELREQPEAKFVWAVDKIIILLMRYQDQGKFYRDNKITKELFDTRLTEQRRKAHAHPVIGEYYEELLQLFDDHPEYFYSS